MIIIRGNVTVNVAERFFEGDYIFGRDHIISIMRLSGLSHCAFAKKYGFKESVVNSWCAVRSLTHKPANPSPGARLKLVLIERELQMLQRKTA